MAVQQVDGLTGFVQALRNHSTVTSSIVEKLEVEGALLVSQLRARCPVESGALRDTIRHEVIIDASGPKLVIHVGDADTFYVRFIEYGTSHEPAEPFIRPVMRSARNRVLAELELLVSKVGA